MSFNNPSLSCIDVDDIAYCEYNWAVDSWTSFSNNCFRHLPEVGDLFIFPAWLIHHVYAFKSDVERISVSGNIEFEPITTTCWN